ncbi:MAG: metallophosphoesterase family protein [Conexivisphaera sp.]
MRTWRFVVGQPALILEDRVRTLVISDLHVGLEEELRRNGVFLPSQTGRLTERILSIARGTGAGRLVLLGDVKHSVTGISPYELRELHEMFSKLISAFSEVIIVPGNHDAGLESMALGPIRLASQRGVVMTVGGRKVGLAHGHTRVDFLAGVDLIVVGHNHFLRQGRSGPQLPCLGQVTRRGGAYNARLQRASRRRVGGGPGAARAAHEDRDGKGRSGRGVHAGRVLPGNPELHRRRAAPRRRGGR